MQNQPAFMRIVTAACLTAYVLVVAKPVATVGASTPSTQTSATARTSRNESTKGVENPRGSSQTLSSAASPKPTPPSHDNANDTTSMAWWMLWLIGLLGLSLASAVALVVAQWRWRYQQPGTWLLVTLAVLATAGLVIIPFSPHLAQNHRWIPVDAICMAILLGGAFLGFLYGLPVVDTTALAGAASATTFLRPSSKLEKITDSLMPAATGGILVGAATQIGKFSHFFDSALLLQPGNAASLLGVASLGYFGPIGFMLGYSVTRTIGSDVFKRADEKLVQASSLVQKLPTMPDLPLSPSEQDRAAAQEVCKIPYAALSGASEKAAWARAQTILLNYSDALKAYQDALVLDPRNAPLLMDYAISIYNDPALENTDVTISLVLSLVDQSASVAGPGASPRLQSRINVVRAAAHLYVAGGYETTIEIVNKWILTPAVPLTAMSRFYRACAFGQLYRSCVPAGANVNSVPLVPGVGAQDFQALTSLVQNDLALTLVAAGSAGLEQAVTVIDPSSPGRAQPSNSNDDDLQVLAIDCPALQKQVGVSVTPALPTSPQPPLPKTMPAPTAVPAGAFAAWVSANCPP